MYQTIMLMTSSLMSLFFIQMNHPLAMGMMLLMQTMLIAMIVGVMTQSFWFSYILFLVFLGGMLVLFLYVTALASNEMFSLNIQLPLIITVLMVLMYYTHESMDWVNKYLNLEMNLMNSSISAEETLSPLIKMYNMPASSITAMLILYLFLTLIAIVSITNIHHGPLRQKN